MTADAARILVVDFGGQYTQLIARRVREVGVYSEILPYDAKPEQIAALAPAGIILSGGPKSVSEAGAPKCDPGVYAIGRPVLGICYGMQLMADALGGHVRPALRREFGGRDPDVWRALMWAMCSKPPVSAASASACRAGWSAASEVPHRRDVRDDGREQQDGRRHVHDRPQAQQALQGVVRVELDFFGHERFQIREPIFVFRGDERLNVIEGREAPIAAAMHVEQVRPGGRQAGDGRERAGAAVCTPFIARAVGIGESEARNFQIQ